MARYVITKIEMCHECDGDGMIESYFWSQYFEDNDSGVDVLAWFARHGISVSRVSDLPTQESKCKVCSGDGIIAMHGAPLLEGLLALGVVMDNKT